MITALAGGVGAARFLRGLVQVVPPEQLTVVVNTADDDRFHDLLVCPDLDSVTYTLAGASNPDTGWGLVDETFTTMGALDRYGAPTWFRLGDRDLATHLFRSRRLNEGATLSEVTAEIAAAWHLELRLLPMTDDRVATRITVRRDDGTAEELAMQEWFVRERAASPVVSVRFDGAADARPAPGVLDAISAADVVLVCPSNPVISIAPILAVPGVRELLVARRDRVVGVSPIIAGKPVKGPADRLMEPLGIEVSCVGVARAYRDFCGALVIDAGDAARTPEVEALGVRARVADTLMTDARVAAALARETLAAVAEISRDPAVHALTVIPVEGIPEIAAGDVIATLVADAAGAQDTPLTSGDCLVVTQKIVSKAEGRLVEVDTSDPEARRRLVESESVRVLRRRGDLLITETRHGFVCANVGVDLSNVADGTAALLPIDGDRSARRIHDALAATRGVDVAVVISDTFGRAWRNGLTDVAIGVCGLAAVVDLRGTTDALGRELQVTEVAIADEVAGAAELVMGKANGVPAAIVRGLDPQWFRESSVRELVRAPGNDLFR